MINSKFDSPLDTAKARVRIYTPSNAVVATCTCEDVLSDFTVSREGIGGKFFGFGICHKLTMNLINIDDNPDLNAISKGYKALIYVSDEVQTSFIGKEDKIYPTFYFDEVTVDKATKDIKIVAYDRLKAAADYTWDDIKPTSSSYNLGDVVYNVESKLGLRHSDATDAMKAVTFSGEAMPNYEGTEDLRAVLDDTAEVICSIYYLDKTDYLIFKQVCIEAEPVVSINSERYYGWEESDQKVLERIAVTTELGNNVGIEVDTNGNVAQFVRDNPFLELREDTWDIIASNSASFHMTPFILDWAGDHRLEIGDCIELITPDGIQRRKVYILSDTVEYAGAFTETTSWEWVDNSAEKESAPTNIGDKINETYAKVDKINKEITLLTKEVDGYPEKMAQMQVTVDSVTTKVSRVEEVHTEEVDALNDRVDTLAKETALKVDAEGVEIIVERTLTEGVDKVVTAAKKYTFDDDGLHVESTGSNISTKITEDGMRIKRAGQEVLTANNEGVRAEDLHATTFLIIGETSRLEDRANRTACFWIGE